MSMTALPGSHGVAFHITQEYNFLQLSNQVAELLTDATLPSPSRSPCATSLGTTNMLSSL